MILNGVKFTKIFNSDTRLRKKLQSFFIVSKVGLIETFTM